MDTNKRSEGRNTKLNVKPQTATTVNCNAGAFPRNPDDRDGQYRKCAGQQAKGKR